MLSQTRVVNSQGDFHSTHFRYISTLETIDIVKNSICDYAHKIVDKGRRYKPLRFTLLLSFLLPFGRALLKQPGGVFAIQTDFAKRARELEQFSKTKFDFTSLCPPAVYFAYQTLNTEFC